MRFIAFIAMILAAGHGASAGILAASHFCNKSLPNAFPARSVAASSGSQRIIGREYTGVLETPTACRA
jgi:hypothetical protein